MKNNNLVTKIRNDLKNKLNLNPFDFRKLMREERLFDCTLSDNAFFLRFKYPTSSLIKYLSAETLTKEEKIKEKYKDILELTDELVKKKMGVYFDLSKSSGSYDWSKKNILDEYEKYLSVIKKYSSSRHKNIVETIGNEIRLAIVKCLDEEYPNNMIPICEDVDKIEDEKLEIYRIRAEENIKRKLVEIEPLEIALVDIISGFEKALDKVREREFLLKMGDKYYDIMTPIENYLIENINKYSKKLSTVEIAVDKLRNHLEIIENMKEKIPSQWLLKNKLCHNYDVR